ncbi:hypothetical protein ACJIZ3_012151 [Penstemon smallii]|uniref:GIR1-like zinc ribbon domain-containing protein n=1 Tax=Penstemon smallii TaxID=265156 RepID=A0ABD3UL80_9LAMI
MNKLESSSTPMAFNGFGRIGRSKIKGGMNYNAESPKLDLKLHLSPPRDHGGPVSSADELSQESSCVSREVSPSSPETRSMILVGCPRCLMYVMLLEEDPKCPKCKSTVLLDFLREDRARMLNN